MNQEGNIAHRMAQYLDIKDVTAKAFAEDTTHGEPFDKGTLGKAISANAKIGAYAVEKFLRMFPEVSPYWLILGDGPMTINRALVEGHGQLEKSYVQTLRDVIADLKHNINDLRISVTDKEKIIVLLETR